MKRKRNKLLAAVPVSLLCVLVAVFCVVMIAGREEPSLSGTSSSSGTSAQTTSQTTTASTASASETTHIHEYLGEVTAPSCTEGGYITYTCACGDSYVADEVAEQGHTYATVTIPPTTQGQGYDVHTCIRCGDAYEDNFVDALPESTPDPEHTHSYTTTVTEPTCTTAGYTVYSCICGDSYVGDHTEALGHHYGGWQTIVQPSCTQNGTERCLCSRCDYQVTRVIAALGHHYNTTTVEATCTQGGYTIQNCVTCGHTTRTETAALGHSWSDWRPTTEGNCVTGGEEKRTCHVCGASEKRTVDVGHSWGDWVITQAATKTVPGERTRSCRACGTTETETVAYGDHVCEMIETVVPPACGIEGYTQRTCSICGYTVITDYTHLEGHEEHDWSEWETVTEPTKTSTGLKQRVCAYCGEIETSVLPMLDEDGEEYESYIDPRIEVKNGPRYVEYRYDYIRIVDRRDWGDPPSIWVNEDGSLTVVFINQEGERVENLVEPPPDGYTRVWTICDDGEIDTYLIGTMG